MFITLRSWKTNILKFLQPAAMHFGKNFFFFFYLVVRTGSSVDRKSHLSYSAESYWFQNASGLQEKDEATWMVLSAEVHIETSEGFFVCLS